MDSRKLTKIYTPTDGRVASLPKNATVQRPDVGVNLSNKVVAEACHKLDRPNVRGQATPLTRKVDAERVNSRYFGNSWKRELQVSNPAHLNNMGGVKRHSMRIRPNGLGYKMEIQDSSPYFNSSRLNRFPVLRPRRVDENPCNTPKNASYACQHLVTLTTLTNLSDVSNDCGNSQLLPTECVKVLLPFSQSRVSASINKWYRRAYSISKL